MKMLENYTLTFSVPSFYLKSVLRSAPRRVQAIISQLKREVPCIPQKKKTRDELYYKNKSNWHLVAKDFSVTEACGKCLKCVALCPVDNIRLIQGKITFSDRCVGCLGCYHRCPNQAIRYKNKKKKDRYVNPNIMESEIGASLKPANISEQK